MLSSEITVPSTPPSADNAVFSDEPLRASSPPSSPPGFPWEQQVALNNATPTTAPPTKTAFSVLGKRKALAPVSDNARPSKKAASALGKVEAGALTQMQISLGQEVQKKCKQCGMEYVASSAEDRKLHDKYHKQNTEGYDVGKDFVQKAREKTVFKGVDGADFICAVDCFDKSARKRRAQAVLDIVQMELGAVPIPGIWDSRRNERLIEPRYRAYLYIRGTKCVAFLLAETITEAHRVLEPENVKADNTCTGGGTALAVLKARKQAAEDAAQRVATQPIQLSKEAYQTQLGISRVWTPPNHRKQDIATTLLDTAILHYNQRAKRDEKAEAKRLGSDSHAKLPESVKAVLKEQLSPVEKLKGKEDVAFSQPTEAGARLARRWFGKLFGWKVYVD